jgi:dTDP-glucose 4,6-dehydratase
LFVKKYPQYQIFNLDALTYAGNLENIVDIEKEPNYTFVKGDIVDAPFIDALFAEHQWSFAFGCGVTCGSFHYRSFIFVKTNVIGTMNLLNAAKPYGKV